MSFISFLEKILNNEPEKYALSKCQFTKLEDFTEAMAADKAHIAHLNTIPEEPVDEPRNA